jgi:hypothetical protein
MCLHCGRCVLFDGQNPYFLKSFAPIRGALSLAETAVFPGVLLMECAKMHRVTFLLPDAVSTVKINGN